MDDELRVYSSICDGIKEAPEEFDVLKFWANHTQVIFSAFTKLIIK